MTSCPSFGHEKKLSSRTLLSLKCSLPCDKRVSVRTADVFPVVASLPPKNNQSGRFRNLETVVTSWSYCSRGKWRIRPELTVSRISEIFWKTFHEAHNIFKSAAYRKPYWKCVVKYSAHFVAYFSF